MGNAEAVPLQAVDLGLLEGELLHILAEIERRDREEAQISDEEPPMAQDGAGRASYGDESVHRIALIEADTAIAPQAIQIHAHLHRIEHGRDVFLFRGLEGIPEPSLDFTEFSDTRFHRHVSCHLIPLASHTAVLRSSEWQSSWREPIPQGQTRR